jgi:hypothetical protein
MFCEKSEEHLIELYFIENSLSSGSDSFSNHKDLQKSIREVMSSFMLAAWETRIDPGD